MASTASIQHVLATKKIVLNSIADNTCSLGVEQNMLLHFLVVECLVFFHDLFVKGFLMIFEIELIAKKNLNLKGIMN